MVVLRNRVGGVDQGDYSVLGGRDAHHSGWGIHVDGDDDGGEVGDGDAVGGDVENIVYDPGEDVVEVLGQWTTEYNLVDENKSATQSNSGFGH